MDYFEDVELGVEIELGRHVPSKEEIVSFATQWDPQPFHIDEEAGRQSVMGGLSASSCHTYSISSLIYSKSDLKLHTAAMLGLTMRFPNPVRRVFLEKRESKSQPAYGIVKSRTTMRNAGGDDVMVMDSNFLVDRRERS